MRPPVRRAPAAAAALLAALAAGCDAIGPHACTTDVVPAVEVEIVDAQTGDWAADDAVGVVRAGTYVDTLRPSRGTGTGELISLAGAFERPGTYRVEITKPGYRDWARDGVRVRDGDCHVETVNLRATLERAP